MQKSVKKIDSKTQNFLIFFGKAQGVYFRNLFYFYGIFITILSEVSLFLKFECQNDGVS